MSKPYALGAVIGGCVLSGILWGQTPAKVDFRRDVQPILKARCYECHGASLQMSGFRLDRRRDAMKGGTIAVIGPGNAAGSRLYWKLVGNRFGPQMPPTGPLKPEQIGIIKAWIDQGAEWPDDLSGETPATVADPRAARLMTALRDGNLEAFRKTLAGDPGAAKRKGPGGSTALMYAALYGDASSMRLLLEKGADPNARNDGGATALMWAADDAEKTRLLIERGADVNAKSEDGRTPLLIASGVFGNTAVMKLLLEHGADVSTKAPSLFGETTPLIEAAYAGDEAAMRMLAERGADLKGAGAAALALSMRANCGGCVKMFMKDPAPSLLTPVMFFASPPRGPALGVKFLLDRGADAKATDPEGNSILVLAAASDAFPVDAIQTLLDRGADVDAKSANGETALELAERQGQTPVVDLLRKAGAREADPPEPAVRTKAAGSVRAAVERSLPLLQQNDAIFLRKSGCVSCHNNTLTDVTLAAARKSGLRVDEQEAQQQLKTIGAYLHIWRERVLQNIGIPGDTDTVGYILFGLAAANYPSDTATDAMACYLKRQQLPDGHWRRLAHRPPLESSDMEVTAVAMRAIQAYAPKPKRAAYDQAVERAAEWLAQTPPQGTEDRAFQLLGLAWSGKKQGIPKAAAALLAEQRADGGWAQIPTLGSDAYATGQALVALQQSGALRPADEACRRGLRFLLNSQAEDGSWHVNRRALPIQPYFESGFPYGRDQFISAAGSNWATTALAIAAR
ncbi:MAG TPA: ankyrin repeat domain-containing protein [Bryobacterales bacterium]|nr:ankyrin repeat domain-containing protein [Bryobacterales bacterium]